MLTTKIQIQKHSSDLLLSIVILLLVLGLRLLTSAAPNVYHSYDTGNVALAVQDFNIAEERPHLPGYFLHIMIIRMLNPIFNSTHFSMIFLSAFYSALGSMLFFKIARKYFEKTDSLLLAFLITSNPLVWFYGSITEIYSFDLFFSTILVFLSLNRKYIFILSAVFALGAGIRQSSAIIFLPFYVAVFYRYYVDTKNFKAVIWSQIIGLICLLGWFLPFINVVGGINNYIDLIKTQNPVPEFNFIRNFFQVILYGFWLFVPLLIVYFFKNKSNFNSIKSKSLFRHFLLISIPSFLVFSFVHYTRGYWLIAISGTFLLIGLNLSDNKKARVAMLAVIAMQILYFLFFPYNLHSAQQFYSSDARTESLLQIQASRIFSQNSVSLHHINALNNFQSDIKFGLATLLKKSSEFKHKLILLDPTIPINERALQASYSEYTFAKLNLRKFDSYFVYKEKKQIPFVNRNNLLNNSIIIGLDKIEKIVTKDIVILFRLNSFIFYMPLINSKSALLKKYDYYFQKNN